MHLTTLLLFAHTTGDFPAWSVLTTTVQHGYGAVVFFFQLSGFVNVITSERRASDYTSPSFRRVFWKRRLSRLVPTFLFANALFLPVLMSGWNQISVEPFESAAGRWGGVIFTLFAIQTWDPLRPLWRLWNYPSWAVSTEIAFYIIFPFVMPPILYVTKTGR